MFMGKFPFLAGVPNGDSPSRQEGKCPWFDILANMIIAVTQKVRGTGYGLKKNWYGEKLF